MKNLIKVALLAMFISLAPLSQSKDLDRPAKGRGAETLSAEEAEKIIARLEEIKAMDFSTMSRKERRVLRREVRAYEKVLHTSGGVYLSVGAIIIIILLLILIL